MTPKIGIEFEGVFLKNGTPIRAARLFGREVEFKDTYDVCSEVRSTRPIEWNSTTLIRDLGGDIMDKMHHVQKEALIHGGDVLWGETLIPEWIHEDVTRNVQFQHRVVHNMFTGVDEQPTNKSANSADRFRGGGMHINISGICDCKKEQLVRLLMYGIPHPEGASEYLPFRSMYRRRGLWRHTEYQRESGIEYRSPGFSFTPLGIKHLYHVLEDTVNVLRRLQQEPETR